jgi:multimeric flavodoxin WrbA
LPGYCAVNDDMQQIYRAFVEADVVVFATPMYWGYMTAQLKAVMDRLEAITD